MYIHELMQCICMHMCTRVDSMDKRAIVYAQLRTCLCVRLFVFVFVLVFVFVWGGEGDSVYVRLPVCMSVCLSVCMCMCVYYKIGNGWQSHFTVV